VKVFQPEVVKGRRFAASIAEQRADFLVTAAYGKLLGRRLLASCGLDAINVHASLLPRHRGAAPANWAILSGDRETGVSIMRMEQGLDTGPVFHAVSTPIGERETAGELARRLAQLGAAALLHVLDNYETLEPLPQDDQEATWAPLLQKSDGLLDWSEPAPVLERRVRGLHPWPCASTTLDGAPLKIHRASLVQDPGEGTRPGTVVSADPKGVDVACGSGVLRLEELQAPGRKRLEAQQFLAGNPLKKGTVLGG
jgi:methionyl-tRNA formyltransferase